MKESKTLFVHPKNDYTGSTKVLANIIETEYSDQEPCVICMNPYNQGFLSEIPNIKIVKIPMLTLFGRPVKFITRIIANFYTKNFIKKFAKRCDTVYLNTLMAYAGAKPALKLGKKITWHVHEKFLGDSATTRIMEQIFNKTPSHRIFVSKYTKNSYPENSNCTSEIKYNKLSNSFLKKVSLLPIEKRDLKNVIMISSLSVAKGTLMFVEVAKNLPNLDFTMIVSDNQPNIQKFFNRKELPKNLTILPTQPDVHPFLKKASLLLNLSHPKMWIETFGMTILEGMAYGVPAIVPNVGGPVELIENDYNGYIVDTTNLLDITEAINKCLSNPGFYRVLASNALTRYKEIQYNI